MSRPSARGANLAVLAALRVEAQVLRRALRGVPVLHTGMGQARACRFAERMGAVGAHAYAVAGLCGGLAPQVEPGDVVVATEVRAPDLEVRRCEGAIVLEGALRALGLRVHLGPIVSQRRLVRGAERRRLARSGALASDMESAWLAAGAGDRPLAVMRVVVDAPGHELVRPALVWRGLRALRTLREAAPTLRDWARTLDVRNDASRGSDSPEEKREWVYRSGS